MKKVLMMIAFSLILIIGCSMLNREASNQTSARESTLILNRDESAIFELVKARIKVCGSDNYVELGRGESKRVDIPVGKCLISTDQGWHSGSYFIEINAEKGKIQIVRISPRGDYTGATDEGFIGTIEERQAHKGKSGPFELIEIKQ
ncbi:MAG: hypothetical protein ABFD50_00465 [Smithella sp.]